MRRREEPQIEIADLKETSVDFILSNVNTSFANAFRRVMIAEIPTVAIDLVDFIQNSTPLPDEMIAHRLGLIPIRSENADVLYPPDRCPRCEGEGCPMCRVTFFCDVSSGDSERIVTTNDFQLYDPINAGEEFASMSDVARTIVPVELPAVPGEDPVPITITKMGKNQQLKFLAHATRGIGRTHAKWSPICACAYRHVPRIEIDRTLLKEIPRQEEKEMIVRSCPCGVLRYDPTEDTIEVDQRSECTFCNQCIEHIEEYHPRKEIISISSEEDKFYFTVETTGVLTPEQIVLKGLDVLKKKLTTLLDEVSSLPP